MLSLLLCLTREQTDTNTIQILLLPCCPFCSIVNCARNAALRPCHLIKDDSANSHLAGKAPHVPGAAFQQHIRGLQVSCRSTPAQLQHVGSDVTQHVGSDVVTDRV
jgi:hypothetical protein